MKAPKLLYGILMIASIAGPASAADRSLGLTLGESGVGLNYTGKTSVRFREADQLQWRVQLSGISIDDEDITLEGNKSTGDVDLSSQRIGVDWYPYADSQFFVTGGVGNFATKIDVKTKSGQSYTVGKSAAIDDGSSLATHIDRSSVAPYVGLGWGNKLRANNGFSFFAELGIVKPLSSADVSVTSTSASVTQADLNAEKKDLEDTFDAIQGFAVLGVAYRF